MELNAKCNFTVYMVKPRFIPGFIWWRLAIHIMRRTTSIHTGAIDNEQFSADNIELIPGGKFKLVRGVIDEDN